MQTLYLISNLTIFYMQNFITNSSVAHLCWNVGENFNIHLPARIGFCFGFCTPLTKHIFVNLVLWIFENMSKHFFFSFLLIAQFEELIARKEPKCNHLGEWLQIKGKNQEMIPIWGITFQAFRDYVVSHHDVMILIKYEQFMYGSRMSCHSALWLGQIHPIWTFSF